jgi:hypothetical protein
MGLGIVVQVDGATDEELAQAVRVEVTERMGQPTVFKLIYRIDIAEGDLPMLADSRLDPGSELTILVPTDNGTHCLVKGPVTGQRIHYQHGGAGSTLEVQGMDNSITMDREAKSQLWSGLTDSDAVSSILGGYGFVPDVEATSAGHFEDKHALVQRGSDLQFVQQLARRNGYLFWMSCDEYGVQTAHFKRPPLDDVSGVELIINLESPNLETFDIEWDVERPTSVDALQLDLNTLSDIDGRVSQTPQTPLGAIDLASITGDVRSQFLSAPSDDAGDLQARGEGALIESGWFIRASCATTLAVLRDLVRAHSVITVRGAGSRYSGSYWVKQTEHIIDDVSHRMNVELLRNAWE